jgi:hypothetical protein
LNAKRDIQDFGRFEAECESPWLGIRGCCEAKVNVPGVS